MFNPTLGKTTRIHGAYAFGASRPLQAHVDGVGDVILKYWGNPQGDRVLVNEVIGHKLCDLLGVDHPDCGIANFEDDSFPDDPVLILPETEHEDQCSVARKTHFYSRLVQPASDLVPSELTDLSIGNPSMFTGAVVVDQLIANRDRSLRNPNILVERSLKHHRLSVIDFGMAFGSSLWVLGNIQDPSFPDAGTSLYGDDFEPFLSRLRNPKSEFEPWLSRASEVTKDDLKDVVAAVPNEWGLTAEERTKLVEYIAQRCADIGRHMLQRLERDTWWK